MTKQPVIRDSKAMQATEAQQDQINTGTVTRETLQKAKGFD